MFNTTISTFEELRDHLWDEKSFIMQALTERLGELSRFEQGRLAGEIQGYENVIELLRFAIKHGGVQ